MLLAAVVAGSAGTGWSATIWDGGGGNDNWSTGANWDDNVAPTSGATLHFAGATRLTPSNDLAAGTAFGSLYFDSGAGSFTLGGNAIAPGVTIENNSSETQTVAMPLLVAGGSTVLIRTILGSGDLTLSGVVSGDGGLDKQVFAGGVTKAILSGSNTYAGATRIMAGLLSISSIRPLGSPLPSSLGMPSAGNGVVAMGGSLDARLIYTGAGDTTDRDIDLAGPGNATLTHNGSGHLTFAGAVLASSNTAHLLTLNGTGTGELAGAISDAASASTRLTKLDSGTWILSGTNTCTGATRIHGGTLSLGGSGSLAGSSFFEIADGAILDVSGVAGFTLGASQSLRGAGTILGDLLAAGTLDPGFGVTAATLSVQGNVSFLPGSTCRVDAAAFTNDRLSVSGDVDLAGATLSLAGLPTADEVVFLTAGGSLSGTFAGLPDGAPLPFTGYAIRYATGAPPRQVVLQKLASPIEYVVHISVDGLHALAPKRLIDSNRGTNFLRFYVEGATTDRARTDYDSTVTSPSHTTMLTGRPVNTWPGRPGHLWGNNDTHPWDRWALTLHQPHIMGQYYGPGPGIVLAFTTPQYYADTGPSKTNYEYVSSVLDVVHDSGRRTCMVYSKNRMLVHQMSYGPYGRLAPNLGPGDPAVNKVDHGFLAGPFGVMSNWIPTMVSNLYHYSFLHFSVPDDRGHSFSWSLTSRWVAAQTNFTSNWNTNQNRFFSGSYMGAVQDVDGFLGELFSLIDTNPALRGKTAIVLTTDHGGLLGSFDHGFTSEPDCFGIPVFAWGPGIPAGGDLYALNRQYKDPGVTNRPDFNAAQQPIRNGDTANLVLSLLGLGPVPDSTINADQSLGVVDTDGDGLSDHYESTIATDPYLRDSDDDGVGDGDELYAGTDPKNAASVLELLALDLAPTSSNTVLRWSSVSNRLYTLWASTNSPDDYVAIGSGIPATPSLNTHTAAPGGAQQIFYRIGVQP